MFFFRDMLALLTGSTLARPKARVLDRSVLRRQLSQHVMQDAAVAVVLDLLGCIQPHVRLEAELAAIFLHRDHVDKFSRTITQAGY